MDDIMSAARRRASVRIFRATGEVVEQIRVHVAPTGGSAMRDDGMSELFGLAPGAGVVDGYVPLGVADEMANAFHLKESAGGNITLREVEFEGAFRHGVPEAAIALDLAEAVSAREQAAGRAVLQRLVDELAAHG
ncbi:hypothetical protein ACIPWF_21970 [Paenarthrobacter sp. NPDC089989]|uniref:hypothetical protein n=1 Tax=unclassified Paenarthrobacter TaxID=2634190 RepID=UPI0037F94AE1